MTITYSGTLTGSDGSTLTVGSILYNPAPSVPPVVTPPPVTTPDNAYISVYWMIYSDSGKVHATSAVASCDEIRLAFAYGSPMQLSGNSPFGAATMQSELKSMQSVGRKIVLAIGGGGNSVDISNTASFLSRWAAINSTLGLTLDGINVDIESSFNGSQLVTVLNALRATYGSKFRISWSPNGSNVGTYLSLAAANSGLVDEFGQQFYDAPVTLAAAESRIDQALSAGLKASQLSVGMMIGTGSNYWTTSQCISNMAAIKAKYGINKAYWWELSRAGTIDAMNGVSALYA